MAANAPDVDIFSYAGGEYFALAFRRGITHGIPAQIVLPFVVAGAMLAWDRWVRRDRWPEAAPALPREILLLAFIGVLTHPVLDWMNVYGMRWGLPFTGSWSYGDALFIIDPWLWLILGSAVFLARSGGAVLWGILAGLTTLLMWVGPVPRAAAAVWTAGVVAVTVLRRTGKPSDGAGRARWARGAVAAAVAYIALMAASDAVGRRQVMAATRDAGLDPADVMLSPTAANPFVSDVEVLTSSGYIPGEHRWFSTPSVVLRPEDEVPLLRHPADVDPAEVEGILARARADADVGHYLVWARYPYVQIRRDTDGWIVRWSDARYDDQEGAGGLSGVTVRVPGS